MGCEQRESMKYLEALVLDASSLSDVHRQPGIFPPPYSLLGQDVFMVGTVESEGLPFFGLLALFLLSLVIGGFLSGDQGHKQ